MSSYQYDAANQLLTATQGSTDPSTGSGQAWHYTYDGNGSLILSMPGDEVANGAKRYTYNTAGFLVQVETYTIAWQIQAEMLYDGLGNRLQMTACADGQSMTTRSQKGGASNKAPIPTRSVQNVAFPGSKIEIH